MWETRAQLEKLPREALQKNYMDKALGKSSVSLNPFKSELSFTTASF